MASSYESKLSKLQDEINRIELTTPSMDTASSGGGSGTSKIQLIGVALPVVMLVLLYLIKPKFVLKDDKKKEVDSKKLLAWSVGLTAVGWGGLYMYRRRS